ncbi:MAG: cytochrome b N-terminal domain-containing protein [Acidobacteriaceae bacterium]|nr:cytochrome b N-terminal domain-containing protein [Acidobacteriaceae bacterium]MBV9502343.1 cytochrome b N-terminal domain-containing protein [Acidobacteriaceae bacterium]
MNTLKRIAVWLDDRLHLTALWASSAGHEVPASSGSWWYVFGSATLLCFVIQVISGACLAFVYIPSTNEAYTSLQYLNHVQFWGWYLRGIHYWGSNFMVAFMSAHMIQVFLFGAYKYPRELTWLSGLFLLLCTLGMAFTGQVMRWDQDAYWGLSIGAAILGRIPLIGGGLVHLVLAGPIIAGETLSRFFTLHVFIIPGLIIAIVGMHLRLVLAKGINEYPRPGHRVRRATYDAEYAEIIRKEGVPFVPQAIDKDLIFSAVTLVLILLFALIVGPKGPHGEPNPTLVDASPRPDFYFLSLFAALALLPDWMETFVMFLGPALAILILIALPFVANTGEKSASRRPAAVLWVILAVLTIVTLAWFGLTSPWSPHMTAWSGDPIPAVYLKGRTPLEMHGALVFQNKQCRNCHALGGVGGERGPALDAVATRLTAPEMVRQVIQGGGNMPAYGKKLTPAEVSALVAFMQTLRPQATPPSQNSAPPENKLPRDVAQILAPTAPSGKHRP